ncbi:polyhydroxyalkanoate granule-associated phasin [Hydrogenophaga pseudoflava]|uniref:polyhydroxyalkanoate granule-associated phasin n=1 Tax=Hydrogenophaga pseudoflava TaxID=47421 RepID=UPI0027E4B330|nr:polyhydroxyalkanoate granule-associated phasin [Hydrogenophaga pseudoflava]MDQ7746724.1 hypothetical protein [Hydrogenophaga pseudoflava]
MSRRNLKTASTLGRKTIETAWVVPQVMAHRIHRMAAAGARPSRRDQKEFAGMVAEKQQAFVLSWMAMTTESLRLQQQIWSSLWTVGLAPWPRKQAASLTATRRMQSVAVAIAEKGLAPVHRKAVSNAKRLSKVRL